MRPALWSLDTLLMFSDYAQTVRDTGSETGSETIRNDTRGVYTGRGKAHGKRKDMVSSGAHDG